MALFYDCNDAAVRTSALSAAAQSVASGQLVVLPTDTVYGIGADAFDAAAIAELLAAKGRGRDMPVPVLVGSWTTIEGLARVVTERTWDLIEAFWPGGLTLVVEHAPSLAWDLGDARGTVAIRMPLHPVAIELLEVTGPMGVSSANKSGFPPALTAEQAREQLGDLVAVYLDGGTAVTGVASTIVDITAEIPRVLRTGAVSLDELRAVVPEIAGCAGAVHSLHPGLEYVLIACIAAAGSFLLTPLARAAAIAWGAVAHPRDRDVHAVAIPRMGGVALFFGFALALFVAARLPTLAAAFTNDGGAVMPYVLLAAAIICAVGVLDDRYELDSLTKLAGQVLAASIMVTLGGVQLLYVPLPWGHSTVSLGQDLGIPVTILLTVLTINAVNFIDGLDGLAAGVTAIGAGAFFLYAHHLAALNFLDIAAVPTLLSAALAGTCIGFLPHNFAPARIFMGDSGSMLVGLMLSAAATTATTSADPQAFGGTLGTLPLTLPLLIPIAVLAFPFVDLMLAIIRRVHRGQSPFAPDKQHLHHRLLQLGHSHRRAVLLLYFWSALLAFGGVAFAIYKRPWVLVLVLCGGILVGALISAVPRMHARRRSSPERPAPRPRPAVESEAFDRASGPAP